jgi:hypothetical protein
LTLDTLVLLPGLDGTGTLFADLISELPPTLSINIARYPTDRFLSYSDLVLCVKEVVPSSPFLLVAESFSRHFRGTSGASPPFGLNSDTEGFNEHSSGDQTRRTEAGKAVR